jgi:hypothetical protein
MSPVGYFHGGGNKEMGGYVNEVVHNFGVGTGFRKAASELEHEAAAMAGMELSKESMLEVLRSLVAKWRKEAVKSEQGVVEAKKERRL